MTKHNPKIFIGSSTKGYPIATKIKECLSAEADCILWKGSDVWEPNKSTFDNLLRMAGYFDFGVFVATADDLTLTSSDKIVIEPRDNVILEMALFLGAMGRYKSFLLVEEGIKLPTDFDGIFMPRFDPKDDKSIESACKELVNTIREHFILGHLSLYPTTALALGYYKNFVAGLVETAQDHLLEFDGTHFTEFKLKVVVPADLNGTVREKAAQFYKRHNLVENALKTKLRNHPAWFQLDKSKAPLALMYDMPTTLSSIDDTIEMILEKNYQGRTKVQEILEQRELNNFRRVLQIQIDKSPFAKATVEIIDEF